MNELLSADQPNGKQRRIGVLYSGSSHQHRTFTEPKYAKWITKLYYLPETESGEISTAECDVLIIPSQLHRTQTLRLQPDIRRFVKDGGIVAALGAQPDHLLDDHHWEFRPTNFWWWLEPGADSGLVAVSPDHDFFRFLTLSDATWHYHGVFHPADDAEVLIATKDGGVILYLSRSENGGCRIMTTLDPEFHYGSYFMPATERFLDGFFPWLAAGHF
ncbi:hypothetical protein [Paenibacillus senegalensis]|uniref:hypothetical protein n=1 Tax=Paenibacillus senegalensis TaxID=1465766 RepID=UPI0002890A18|nr:hypothetical protein [Paenibacillus senegalensis]